MGLRRDSPVLLTEKALIHIPDGILPVSVNAAGYAVTAATTWWSLRKINRRENPRADIPKASLLTAAFFVASWIHIPVPPTSVHLVLNGLLGAILGYFAFPAILIGLFFQAVMFQHGGLTTLGVNAVVMGVPALAAHYVFRLRHAGGSPSRLKTGIFGFLAGAGALAISVLLFVTILLTSMPADIAVATERQAITLLAMAHIPLVFIEGTFTALVAVYIQRVRPRMLDGI